MTTVGRSPTPRGWGLTWLRSPQSPRGIGADLEGRLPALRPRRQPAVAGHVRGGPGLEAIGQAGSFFHELFHDGRHHRRPLPLNPTRHGAQLVAAGGPPRLRSLAVAAAVVGLLAGIVGAAFCRSPLSRPSTTPSPSRRPTPPPCPRIPPPTATTRRRCRASDQRGVGLFGAYAVRRRLRCPVGADRTRPAAGPA